MSHPTPNTIVTWQRPQATLYDDVSAATVTLNATLGARATVSITPGGAPVGTIVVSGTVGGSPLSETLEWTGAPLPKSTFNRFDTVTTLVVAGTGFVVLEARAVAGDGTPANQTVTLHQRLPVALDHARADYAGEKDLKVQNQGATQTENLHINIIYDTTWTPRKGDIALSLTGNRYKVTAVTVMPDEVRPRYWDCRAVLYEA